MAQKCFQSHPHAVISTSEEINSACIKSDTQMFLVWPMGMGVSRTRSSVLLFVSAAAAIMFTEDILVFVHMPVLMPVIEDCVNHTVFFFS